MLLDINNLFVHYGKAEAIRDISLVVQEKSIVTLVGNNGAGKTTIMKAISGLIKPTSGWITFKGNRIDTYRPEDIVAAGISHCPEGRHIFPYMSVKENLLLGAYLPRARKNIPARLEDIYNRLPVIKRKLNQEAGTLSGGEQQMLAIGRALMSGPELLLLDEPSIGLSPLMVGEVAKIIKIVNDAGTSILLVEQNCVLALKLGEKGYVLELGQIVLQDYCSELLGNEHVKKAFLGL